MYRIHLQSVTSRELLTKQRRQQASRHGRHHLLAGCDIWNGVASITVLRAHASHGEGISVYPVVVLAVGAVDNRGRKESHAESPLTSVAGRND